MQNIDFNPLIPNGMRLFQLSISFKTAYFNPLIPNGMRRFYHLTSLWCPLFQSTHPKRDETKTSHQFRSRIWFQSTHPKRDETISGTWIWQRAYQISIHSSQTGWDQFVIDARVAFFRISIHSSQTGWDIGRFVVKGTNNWFQSTHPKRDETILSPDFFVMSFISIHSSQTGWDEDITPIQKQDLISIHSSQTGWDYIRDMNLTKSISNFNPLIPNGMRPVCHWCTSRIL